MTVKKESKTEKRGRGRPRLHDEIKMVTLRCPVGVAAAITGALTALKLTGPEYRDVPIPVFVMEGLKLLLLTKENQNRSARSKIKALDKALAENYAYLLGRDE